jgi:hypothetical protein
MKCVVFNIPPNIAPGLCAGLPYGLGANVLEGPFLTPACHSFRSDQIRAHQSVRQVRQATHQHMEQRRREPHQYVSLTSTGVYLRQGGELSML